MKLSSQTIHDGLVPGVFIFLSGLHTGLREDNELMMTQV
jgi:hypothetical protein